jgi:hypothetical protein
LIAQAVLLVLFSLFTNALHSHRVTTPSSAQRIRHLIRHLAPPGSQNKTLSLIFGMNDTYAYNTMLSTHPPGFRVYREVPASTSPPTAVEELKTSKKKKGGHVRRQNRSCDQCRKGKRRCDAAVLRDRGDGTQYEDEEWEYDGMFPNASHT